MPKKMDRARLTAGICDDITDGLTLRQACAKEGRPAKTNFLRWIAEDAALRDQYAHARERQAEHMADEILEICDDGTNDWMKRENGDGESYEAINHEHISRSKLRVDARKWLMSKLAPKKYGDRITQEHAGEGGGPIQLVHTVERRIVDPRD